MIVLRRPSSRDLDTLFEDLSTQPLTYCEIGATSAPVLPPGYHHVRSAVRLGRGEIVWERAREALLSWAPQVGAGLVAYPAGARVSPGSTVLFTKRVGPMSLVIPCRVVYSTDEPGRAGYAYGTLPGHPEVGEEAFQAVRSLSGEVTFEVTAFSRPGDLVSRVAGPVSRVVQKSVTRRYLQSLAKAVGSAG